MFEKDDEFREFYQKKLNHKFAELEPKRRKYLFLFCLSVILFLIFNVVLDYLPKNVKDSSYLGNVWFGAFAAACYGCAFSISKFKSKTKSLVMGKILRYFGKIKYCRQRGALITEEDIKQSGLFGDFDELDEDDAFEGKFQDVPFIVSEQELIKRVVSFVAGKEYDKPIFRGVLIALNLEKNSSGKTVVYGKGVDFRKLLYCNRLEMILFIFLFFMSVCFWWQNRDYHIFYFAIGLFVFLRGFDFLFNKVLDFLKLIWNKRKQVKKEEKKQVYLEDVVFSKKWKVYADDQVEARYVLTPALMERMLKVKKVFHGNRIDFSFWKNNLLIAVHTNKDMFETTSLFKSTLSYKKVREVYYQLQSIFAVIDVLKMNSSLDEKREL